MTTGEPIKGEVCGGGDVPSGDGEPEVIETGDCDEGASEDGAVAAGAGAGDGASGAGAGDGAAGAGDGAAGAGDGAAGAGDGAAGVVAVSGGKVTKLSHASSVLQRGAAAISASLTSSPLTLA